MQAVKETLSNAKLRPTKMIQPKCSNLVQTLTLGCMLGLTGYFGGISADYKVYRAPIEPTLCHLHTTAMARFHLIGRRAPRVYTPCWRSWSTCQQPVVSHNLIIRPAGVAQSVERVALINCDKRR
ncbi:hypothetical protein D6C92_05126 [Aureobasidium pullulans]|uniref:Uncharacterized protein n=1 Tax=Aureobasidium pullulans TaxID=5580 RepID=A0A4S9R7U1_AURPU|nr:hypothetical protein D6D28_00805 [Aureobasidium pullulans]THY93946.1 hypothetical protein D6C92_05126 [Aureobasidium pullulans]TIA02327.1 hypothetical protein D6C81_10712 [Aureobasidium pullulans]